MKYAIVGFGYDYNFAVPVEKVSKLLEVLKDAVQVESKYIGSHNNGDGGTVYFKRETARTPRVELTEAILDQCPEDPKEE